MDITKYISLIIIVFLVSLLIGCANQSVQNPPKQDEVIQDKTADDNIEPTIIDKSKEIIDAISGCDLNQDPSKTTDIEISMFKTGIEKNDEGLVFDFKAIDADGNILPVEGSLGVEIRTTELFNGERQRGEYEIFRYSFPIKKAELNNDCSSKDLIIKFDAIEGNKNYQYILPDDPGMIRFQFTRTGSRDQYIKTYNPKVGESLFSRN